MQPCLDMQVCFLIAWWELTLLVAQNCLCPSLISGLNFCSSAFCTLQIGGGSRPVCRASWNQMCKCKSLSLRPIIRIVWLFINHSSQGTGQVNKSQCRFCGFEDGTKMSHFRHKSHYLKSSNVFNSHDELVPFSEDALTTTLALIFLTFSSNGSIFLLLSKMQ